MKAKCMSGIKKIILITAALFFMATAVSAVSYRTPELRRLAHIVGLNEATMHPGVNYYDGCTVILDSCMTVRHVGLTLFSEEIKQISNRPVLEFAERYFLQLYHPAPNSSAALMIHSDGIVFSKGKWQDIKHVNQATPFDLDYHLMRYTLTWKHEGSTLSFSFPGKYQLICGENLLQAEEHLPNDIRATISPEDRKFTTHELQPTSTDGHYIKKGTWYYSEMLNASTYYLKKEDNTLEPIVDVHFLEESVADIMLCPEAAEPFTFDVTMHRYGYIDTKFNLPIRQWIDYCKQNGCEIYCGIESTTPSGVKATVIAVNKGLNFNHLLTVTVPIAAIESGRGSIKAELNAFIPTHNIINLEGKFKKTKTKHHIE